MKYKEKYKELNEWVKNISFIQNEILKVIGYEVKQKSPNQMTTVHPYLYIEKISDKENEIPEIIKKEELKYGINK
ncbi:unnamed protein product [marine sediment metagenome]|uniref:Uncharacterized protein n=1 Tax=marine sediment metagenome TaxID=412755 RepID=X0VCZ7_9ZZZZ